MAVPSVRSLKIAIITMGVLIVVCFIVLVVGLARRAGTAPVAAAGMIAVPAGATVEGSDLDGRRMLLRLRLTDGRQRLLIADTETGKALGHFDFVPEPVAGH